MKFHVSWPIETMRPQMCVALNHEVLSVGGITCYAQMENEKGLGIKHREVKKLVPDHIAGKGHSWDLNSSSLTQKFMHLTMLL